MSGRSFAKEVFVLEFYFNGSPNPTKVALFLEEAGLENELIPDYGDTPEIAQLTRVDAHAG